MWQNCNKDKGFSGYFFNLNNVKIDFVYEIRQQNVPW